MPLSPCPACANQVSHEALTCPQCGHPLKNAAPQPGPPPAAGPAQSKSLSTGCLIAVIAAAILPVLVAVIGILAAIAIPNFLRFQVRARQSEAKVNLKVIYTASRAHFAEDGVAATTFEELGFTPEPGHLYTYFYGDDVIGTMKLPREVETYADRKTGEFLAVAIANIDSDSTLDVWTIDDENVLEHPSNDLDE